MDCAISLVSNVTVTCCSHLLDLRCLKDQFQLELEMLISWDEYGTGKLLT